MRQPINIAIEHLHEGRLAFMVVTASDASEVLSFLPEAWGRVADRTGLEGATSPVVFEEDGGVVVMLPTSVKRTGMEAFDAAVRAVSKQILTSYNKWSQSL